MRKYLSITSFIIATGFLVYFIVTNNDKISVLYLKVLNPLFLVLITILLLIFVSNGIRIAWINMQFFDIRMKIDSWLELPLAMSYAGMVFPIKGGALYQMQYFKKNYDLAYSNSVSNIIITTLMPISLIGFIAFVFALVQENLSTGSSLIFGCALTIFPLTLASVLFLSSLQRSLDLDFSFISKLRTALLATKNWSPYFVFVLLVLSLIKLCFEISWFLTAFYVMGINVEISFAIFLVLIRNIAAFIKIVPGNIGINELLATLSSSFVGCSDVDSFSTMLLLRVTSLILTFTMGLYFFNKKPMF